MGSHNGKGDKAGPWECARGWIVSLPYRAVLLATAECSTAAEPRKENGSRAKCLWLETCHMGDHTSCRATVSPPSQADCFCCNTMGSWATALYMHLRRMNDVQGLLGRSQTNGSSTKWVKCNRLSNLMTVPDPMSAEITRKVLRPALAKVAGGDKGLALDAFCQACYPITLHPWTLDFGKPQAMKPDLVVFCHFCYSPPSWGLSTHKVNVFGYRFLYLENGPLAFSSLCTILLQWWFVVVFWLYLQIPASNP